MIREVKVERVDPGRIPDYRDIHGRSRTAAGLDRPAGRLVEQRESKDDADKAEITPSNPCCDHRSARILSVRLAMRGRGGCVYAPLLRPGRSPAG